MSDLYYPHGFKELVASYFYYNGWHEIPWGGDEDVPSTLKRTAEGIEIFLDFSDESIILRSLNDEISYYKEMLEVYDELQNLSDPVLINKYIKKFIDNFMYDLLLHISSLVRFKIINIIKV